MAEAQKSLEQTPTWAVFLVATVFVVASLVVERGIKYLGKRLKKSDQKELLHTLEVIKDELMLLGFISLSLTVFQQRIASLCMPARLRNFMLPCKYIPPAETSPTGSPAARRLLSSTTTVTCPTGKVQVISQEGLHQLHIFIFVMAVVHVLYSAITVLVGLWEVHTWKKWEIEAGSDVNNCVDQALNPKTKGNGRFVPHRLRYGWLQTSRTGLNLDSWVYSFVRQFGRPIYKEDYLCLRLGFIEHHKIGAQYDFHSYIRRCMEKDFRHVVGISSYLWAFVCLFLLVDIYGWYTYFWLAFVPTVMVLAIGAKLQQIITNLAVDVRGGVEKISMSSHRLAKRGSSGIDADKTMEPKKCNPITPRDDLFWFKCPRLLLFLIHFILFQNAFELAFFFWTIFAYGYGSCLVGKTWMVVVRLVVGAFVQLLCSASILPLYAIVHQLGSSIRFEVFKSEQTRERLKDWKNRAKASHEKEGHIHQPVFIKETKKDTKPPDTKPSHRLGIIGLTKDFDEHGHVINIPLPHANGNQPHHHGHHQTHPHGHPPHAHAQPHQDEFHTVEISEQPLEGAPEVGLAPPAEAAAPQSAASKSLLFAVDKLLKSKKSKPDSEEPSSKPSDDSSAQ